MEKKEQNFEEAMKQLEEIANELEKGKLSLEESVIKFEEGMKLSKQCSDMIESAEKKITILMKDGDELKEEEFKPTEE